MSVDERSRYQLYQRLQEVLGSEEASTLMEHLPPGGVGQLATKDDLQALKHELLAEIHRVARSQMLSFAAIMAVLNGSLAAVLTLGA